MEGKYDEIIKKVYLKKEKKKGSEDYLTKNRSLRKILMGNCVKYIVKMYTYVHIGESKEKVFYVLIGTHYSRRRRKTMIYHFTENTHIS